MPGPLAECPAPETGARRLKGTIQLPGMVSQLDCQIVTIGTHDVQCIPLLVHITEGQSGSFFSHAHRNSLAELTDMPILIA
jgi:hypothetical protein